MFLILTTAASSPADPAAAALRRWLKCLSRIVGGLLLTISIAYIVRRGAALDWGHLIAVAPASTLILAAVAAAGYATLLIALAWGWCRQADRERRLDARSMILVYGRGVIAKYVPGSVLQYASRQWLGGRLGMKQSAMARASATEMLLHLLFAALVSLGLIAVGGVRELGWSAVALSAVLLLIGKQWSGWRPPLIGQATFFAGFALIVFLLAGNLGGFSSAALWAGWFFAAWLAGFLVPLAPGGIGVREAVLMVLAGPSHQTSSILVFALLLRVVTLLGDAIFGAVAYLMRIRTA